MKVQEARADYIWGTTGQRDWPIMTIEEIADVNPRVDKAAILDDLPVSFVPMPAVGAADGSIRVEETRRAGEVKKGFTAFLEGDVLFAKITPCMENGKMAIVPKLVNDYGFGSTEFHVLRPKPGMDAKYIYYYVSSQAFRGEAERYMTGAVGQKRVSTTYLKQATIPVAPLDQQKRIVAEIEKQFSRLDEAVANLKRVKANLKRYKAAVLKAAVEGRLVETEAEIARREGRSYETGAQLLQRILETRRSQWQGKGKYKEPAPPDSTDLPELPEGWVWASTEQVCGSVRDGTHDTPAYVDSGVPLITSKNLTEHGIDFENVKLISEQDHTEISRRSGVEYGDVLFAMIGTVGNPCVIKTDNRFSIKNVGLFKRNPECLNSTYLRHWLESSLLNKWLEPRLKGTTQKFASLGLLREIPVPYAPLTDQQRIVAEIDRRVSLIRGTAAQVDTNLHRAERMRQALLSSLFTGKWTTRIREQYA
ncbi:MAG: restriction endonuclease subunit S [Proteobacteria bacterium]|jgi:type I restriction enzyme S subunit|nr:restriction endonuclease subunit S [Pseudomonadota bacterium]